jgi:hypothetical protein
MLQANSASSGLNCFTACAPLRKGQLAIVPLTDLLLLLLALKKNSNSPAIHSSFSTQDLSLSLSLGRSDQCACLHCEPWGRLSH